ncbi:MAG: DUF4349 domain-containing protein, partial [Solirubrobacteraceae bacterium]
MRQFDEESQRALAVIEETLAGAAVAPQDAELAELTLILAGQRPEPDPAFTAALDQRVAQRFASPPAAGAPAPAPAGQRRRRWLYAPGAACAMAAAAAGVIIVVSSGSPPRQLAQDLSTAPGVRAPATSAESSSASSSTTAASSAPATSAQAGSSASSSAGSAAATRAAAPATPGRQVVRSAQISLSTRPSQVDNVAQQVFTVVANQNGVVESSTVTATNNASGYAQFQLSVPNANLGPAMAALSRLRGAAVVSRNDVTQDVTGRVGGAGRNLADARARRTALLRQLAIASTTTAINSLQTQIRDANASIASDLATLRALQRRVASSQISLTINASMIVGHQHSSTGDGFTLGRAADQAGRVLVVAAGVALIALAVLVPVGLLAGLGLWVGYAVRRRRREQTPAPTHPPAPPPDAPT